MCSHIKASDRDRLLRDIHRKKKKKPSLEKLQQGQLDLKNSIYQRVCRGGHDLLYSQKIQTCCNDSCGVTVCVHFGYLAICANDNYIQQLPDVRIFKKCLLTMKPKVSLDHFLYLWYCIEGCRFVRPVLVKKLCLWPVPLSTTIISTSCSQMCVLITEVPKSPVVKLDWISE